MLRTKTVKMIEEQDWSALVTETYGRPYDFQQQDGCKERGVVQITIPDDTDDLDYDNDTLPETVNHKDRGVSFKAWLARDPEQKLNADDWDDPAAITMWWERNFYPHVQMIANDLHTRGLVEAGEYYINIDW